MSVQPDPDATQLTSGWNLLKALHDPSRSDHKDALGAMENAVRAGQVDFGLLMLHIFAHGGQPHRDGHLRQLAGIVVKNFCLGLLVPANTPLSAPLQSALLQALRDEQLDIRRTAAALIGSICRGCEWSCWLPLLSPLMQQVGDTSAGPTFEDGMDGCVHALRLVCEDASESLARDPGRCLETLVPLLLQLLPCPHSSIRLSALLAMNALLPLLDYCNSPGGLAPPQRQAAAGGPRLRTVEDGAQALVLRVPALLTLLGNLATDSSPEIRRAVCGALVVLASGPLALLAGCLPSVCAFMEVAVGDAAEGVAKEAIEFWLVLVDSEDDVAYEALHAHVASLSCACILRLTLTAAQLQALREEEESQASGEKRVLLFKRSGRSGGGREDADDNDQLKYTVRRRAALLLDNLASLFPHETAAAATPLIQERLQATADSVLARPPLGIDASMGASENASLLRESAMLALGALAGGAQALLQPALPQMYPHLLTMLADPMPETRAIACWTLSRFVDWVLEGVQSSESEETVSQGREHFLRLVQGLLGSMVDRVPHVQQAACTALTHLISESDPDLLLGGAGPSLLAPVIQQVGRAFHMYGVKNRLLLLDVVRALAEQLGPDFCAVETGGAAEVKTWLPPVLALFCGGGDDEDGDVTFSVAAECLVAVVGAMGTDLANYAGGILSRCVFVAQRDLSLYMQAEADMSAEQAQRGGGSGSIVSSLEQFAELGDQAWDLPAKDNVSGALELLSALLDASGPEGAAALYAADTAALEGAMQVALQCMRDLQEPTCRQAAFSLLGEVLRSVPVLLFRSEHLTAVLAAVEESLSFFINCDDPQEREAGLMAFNNVCWVLGLLAVASAPQAPVQGLGQGSGAVLQAHLSRLLFPLVTSCNIVSRMKGSDAELTFQNIAICVGRLGMVAPTNVGVVLPEVLGRWLKAMLLLDISDERDSEFGHTWLGLLAVLNAAPRSLLDSARAGAAFVELCAAQVALPLPSEQVEGLLQAGSQPWVVSPSLLVADAEINRSVASILRALQLADPARFAGNTAIQPLLAAFL